MLWQWFNWYRVPVALAPAAWLVFALPLASQTYLPAVPGGLNDTERIEQALDACNSPKTRCRVQLGPGVFEVEPIVVENFHGTFVGAGIGNTVIKAKPGLEVHFTLSAPPSKDNRWPLLFSFLSGDFTIADMSIRVEEYQPVKAYKWLPDYPDTFFMDGIVAISQKAGRPAPKARIEHVELSGADGDAGPFYGYNLPSGFGVNTNCPLFFGAFFFNPPMSGGSLRVKDSILKRGASGFGTLKTAGIEVELTGNRILESIIGIEIDVASESDFRIFNNVLDAWSCGISFWQTPYLDPDGWGPPKPSRYYVSRNAIRASQIVDLLGAGISIKDDYTGIPGERARLDAIIDSNKISSSASQGGQPGYGVWLQATAGSRIVNNQVEGAGIVALAVDGAKQCRLLFNSIEKFHAAKAQLWFSPASSDCLAVGVPQGVTVLDEGKNNKITGRWWN